MSNEPTDPESINPGQAESAAALERGRAMELEKSVADPCAVSFRAVRQGAGGVYSRTKPTNQPTNQPTVLCRSVSNQPTDQLSTSNPG